MGQIAFLRDHLDEVASDMSVFHRVDDILEDLDGPTLWRLAWRLPNYRGCMRVVVENLQQQESATTAGPDPSTAPRRPQHGQVVQGTATALRSAPAFAGDGTFGPLFEVTEVKAT